MATNGATHRKGLAEDEVSEDPGMGYLQQIKSSGAMTITPELFEKLYLTPKVAATGDFRKRFANPTPLGLLGFILSSTTFGAIQMGWGGANSLDAVVGIFYFTGPILLLSSMLFEWVMGNFLSMMIMGMFGVFWLSFGVLQTPTLNIAASYSATGDEAQGAASVGYNAAIAIYLMVWGFWLFTTWIFTLKTNTVFALIFLLAFISAFVFAGAYWKVSTGDYDVAKKLQKAGGAIFFTLAILGWYMTAVIMATEMRMTTRLPVGDLSHFWPQDLDLAEMEKNA